MANYFLEYQVHYDNEIFQERYFMDLFKKRNIPVETNLHSSLNYYKTIA